MGRSSAPLLETEEELPEGTESQHINDLLWSAPISTTSTTLLAQVEKYSQAWEKIFILYVDRMVNISNT